MNPLAGNQTDARRRAQQEYESAARSGADKQVLDRLYADVLDKQAAENAATSQSDRPRKLHW